MKRLFIALAVVASPLAQAEVAPILVEACNLFQLPGKRAQCLRAAEQSATSTTNSTGQQRNFAASSVRNSASSSAAAKASTARSSGGATCYTGPRGGTYTITASGRKNYNGC